MEHGESTTREKMLENGDLKAPLNLQNRSLTVQGRKAAWRCKYLKLWKRNQVGDSMSMDC